MILILGECRIGGAEITTFDGVVYEPRFVDGCQYMALAATGPDDKAVILLDRGSNAQNQVGLYQLIAYSLARHTHFNVI